MNNEERYYREELDYLRQLAKMLAIENPDLQYFLESKGSEPDIERVFEAFSILSGHMREKIEDSFPEITHPMLNTLWPHYLRPTPSMTIIRFKPDVDEITTPALISHGMILQSAPKISTDKKNDTKHDNSLLPCTFTLSRDVWLMPIAIDTITARSSLQQGVMDVNISISRLTDLNALDLNKLRFWLNDEDEYTRYQLYLWLSVNITKVELISGGYIISQPDMLIAPVGFEKQDALLSYPEHTSEGFRILQEYLCYPDSFLFFNITGVRKIPVKYHTDNFTLRFHFNTPFPADLNIKNDTLRLHCSPAVNIFPHGSEKIPPGEQIKTHPLRVSERHPDHYDIYAIMQVRNKIRSANKRKGKTAIPIEQHYTALNSFPAEARHCAESDVVYYQLHQKTSLLHNRFDHAISFVHADGRRAIPSVSGNKKEDITVSMMCTNNGMPEFVQKGDITKTTEVNPAVASFTNITRPTQPLPPVTHADQHWSLLSSMNLSYLTLLDVEGIRQILHDFDLPGICHPNLSRLSAKKLQAIEDIQTRPVDRLFKGIPVRGVTSTLYLRQAPFASVGEMYLLSTVLSYVLALYFSENSFHVLKMVNLDSGECYEWEARRGQHKLM